MNTGTIITISNNPHALKAHYDGDHTQPFPHGPTVASYDSINRCWFFSQKMRCSASYFQPLAIGWKIQYIFSNATGGGVASPNNSYLYEETEPQTIRGDVIEWTRKSCTVPVTRVESGIMAYSRQWVSHVGTSYFLFEMSRPEACKIIYAYQYCSNDVPRNATPATRYLKTPDEKIVLDNPLYIGQTADGLQTNNAQGMILGETTTVERWKGLIYRITAKFVQPTGTLIPLP